jgi:Fur family ferric uptake transcriptional regulator
VRTAIILIVREAGLWAEHARGVLRGAGYHTGAARETVLELLSGQNCCLTAQEIFDALRAKGRKIGIASVYRSVDVLAELGLLQRVDVGDGVMRFQPVRPGGDHHHHLVCDDCGKVERCPRRGAPRRVRRRHGADGGDPNGTPPRPPSFFARRRQRWVGPLAGVNPASAAHSLRVGDAAAAIDAPRGLALVVRSPGCVNPLRFAHTAPCR